MDSKSLVSFKYKVSTQPGQEIYLTGNCTSLGNWNLEKAVHLNTNPDIYPCWTTPSDVTLPLKKEVEYKYLTLSNDTVVWESIPYNRKLYTRWKYIAVEDEENSFLSKIHEPPRNKQKVQLHFYENFFKKKAKLGSNDSIVIVSLALPVKVTINPSYDFNDPLSQKWLVEFTRGIWQSELYAVACKQNINFKWIGHPGIYLSDSKEQKELSDFLQTNYNCSPLFIPEDLYYLNNRFCNGVLSRLFHNIVESSPAFIPQYPKKLWRAYKQVNILFADKILQIHNKELIWIHDYHLFLTPSFLSHKAPEPLNIGFYLHIPFPSSDVYKVLAHRETILHALLCCDLIGFHLFEYARHFIGSCKRLLGLDFNFSQGGYLSINYFGRNIMLRVGHLGVEPERILEVQNSEEYHQALQDFNAEFIGKKVYIGIDPIHRLSGIPLKLKAFRHAVKGMRYGLERLVLYQVLTPPKTSTAEETCEVRDEILELQRQINAEFGFDLVKVVERDITSAERYAMMWSSYGIIISSIREGLCLLPFEYLTVTQDKAGEVVLSEFTGVSRALSSPRRVNPFDFNDLENAIFELVSQPFENTNKRKRDINYIYKNTTTKWAKNFLVDLKKARKNTNEFQYVTHGLGDGLKLIALNKSFTNLNINEVLDAYKKSNNRLLLFDNEGTLSNHVKLAHIDQAEGPSDQILSCLNEICIDKNNTVFVVTGRQRKIVERWFKTVQFLGMAAEYGAYLKWNAKSSWNLRAETNGIWLKTAEEIIKGYVQRTEGTSMIVKECSVVFDFRDADPEFSNWQAKELQNQLEMLLNQFLDSCEISIGMGYVEVKPVGITKGTTLYTVLKKVFKKKGPVDFILAMGDDSSDEEMFKVVQLVKNSPMLKPNCETFTCTVGLKPSLANHYVLDSYDILQLLKHLKSWSFRSKNNSQEYLGRISRKFTPVDFSNIVQEKTKQTDEESWGEDEELSLSRIYSKKQSVSKFCQDGNGF